MSTHVYTNPILYASNSALQYNFAMETLSNIKINPIDQVLKIFAIKNKLENADKMIDNSTLTAASLPTL